MFYTVDTTTRLLLAGPTVQFPDGTVLTEDTKDDFTFPVQGWEWHPSDEAAYEAMAPEMLPVLAQQVAGLPIPPPPEPDPMADMQAQLAAQQDQLAAQQALIDELLAALGGGGNG